MNKNTNGKWICQVVINGYCCGDIILKNENGTERRNHLKAKHQAIYDELTATEQDKALEASFKQSLLGKKSYDKESKR